MSGWHESKALLSPGLGSWAAGAALLGVCYYFWGQPKRQAEEQQSTSFSSFLKAPPAPAKPNSTRPTSFAAFLKETDVQEAAEQDSGHADAKDELPQDDDAVVPILFGTEFGFCREIADKLAAELKATDGYWPLLLDMAQLSHVQAVLERQQVLLVVCSTQGEGVPPSEARACCDWLQSSEAPSLKVPFSVLAAGDRTYVNFCACGKALDARFEALGGERFHPRTDLNKEDWKAVDSWIVGVLAGLSQLELEPVSHLGGPEAVLGKADASAEGRSWSRSRPYAGTVVAVESLCTMSSADDKDTVRVEIDLGDSGLSYEPGDALGVYAQNSTEAVTALLEAGNLSGSTEVSVPKWQHSQATGTMLPLHEALRACYDIRTPRPQLLELLLRLLVAKLEGSLSSETSQTSSLAAEGHGAGMAHGSATSSSDSSLESADAVNGSAGLSEGETGGKNTEFSHSNLPQQGNSEQPRKQPEQGQLSSQHSQANGHANGHDEAASSPAESSADDAEQHSASTSLKHTVGQLRSLLADAAAEAYYEPRHVIDILQDYWQPWSGGEALPVPELLAALRPLIPRLYSISSSPLEHPTRVQITVAAVRYMSLDLAREGVASNFLASGLKVGDPVPVYLFQNPDFRLPKDPSTPIIMVGPGTGLAPFRSFVIQRQLQHGQQSAPGEPKAAGRNLLFFGCRRRDQDYLYGHQLEAWSEEGVLELHTAFSREQGHKVYVQDRIRQAKDRVWELLSQGAHLYICGDAANMAGSVEAALLEILAEKDPDTPAKQALEHLAAQHRYQKDVWY